MQIAFYKGRKRFFNRLVCFWLRGPYSHCELIFDTDADGVSECVSSSFTDGGVRVKMMKLDPAHWDIVTVPHVTPLMRARALDWLDMHEADGYDVLGLLGFVWRREKGWQSKWFCSEAVAAMLGYAEPWRFDPMNLFSTIKSGDVR